jgi:hypothetical protein
MHITDEALQEFQEIWAATFDERLSLNEARHSASQLIELYSLFAKPFPSEGSSLSAHLPAHHEVLPVLPKVERGRRPADPFDRIAESRNGATR